MALFLISSLLFGMAVVIIHWLHGQYGLDIIVDPVLPQAGELPLISICIPARNEEGNIRRCVDAALSQDYPNCEVIVVDDRSTDTTGAILQAFGSQIILIEGGELPDGWAGKPHALFQAAAAARGTWLCFVDADTTLHPNAISACYAKAVETKADLFTVMTRQVLGSFWERVVMPLVMTALSVGFSPRKVNDSARRDAIANGQFILIRRITYDAVGGHEKIRDQIVEDKALSEQVKWNGHRLVVADGMQVVSTRMYTSLSSMWEGWTKNIYLGLRDRPALMLLGVFGALLALLAALFLPLWPFIGLLYYVFQGEPLGLGIMLEALIIFGYLIFMRIKVARAMDIPTWYAWTTPVGAGIFAAMMLTSAFKVISGRGVTWKGRRYKPAG